MTTAQSLAERQNLLDLLKASYEILGGIVRRWAVWERAGAHDLLRRPESSSTAVDLAGDTIPYLRSRLGLAPDPSLAELIRLIRSSA
jgi:hypothetical protein